MKDICLATGLECIRCNPGACESRKETKKEKILYKNISLKEMLETEVNGILTNYKSGSQTYYYQNGEGEFHEITELDLLRGRFVTEDCDFSEFEWELEESHIYIRQ